MGSFLTPSDSLNHQISVRILSHDPFDCEDIHAYPKTQGWGRRTIREWQDLFTTPTPAIAAGRLGRLFFGLLTSLTIEPAIITEFLDGRTSVGLDSLCALVDVIFRLMRDSPDRVQIYVRWRENYLAPILAFHNRLAGVDTEDVMVNSSILEQERDLVTYLMHPKHQDPRDPADVVATAILLEYLQRISVSTFFPGDKWELPRRLSQYSHFVLNANIMWMRLREGEWCPFEIEVMSRRLSNSALQFMSNLPRPDKTAIHNMIRIQRSSDEVEKDYSPPLEDRSLCKPYECSTRQLSDDGYKTAHCSDCTGCFDVEVDAGELEEILLQDEHNIPLIMSIDPNDDSRKVHLVAAQPHVAYIAISHVWSDGLGNPMKNAIPHCQMLRLSKLVRSLPGANENTLLFWFDTLCVPPDGTGQDTSQALALERMRETYESANAVLVLDKWLLSTPDSLASDTDLIMKISISVWNRRLWTYQEGALARTLLFQLHDSIFNIDEAYSRLCESDDWTMVNTLLGDIHTAYTSLRGFRRPGQSFASKLRGIVDACMLRGTSVSTDEALCLAALLDLPMPALLSSPPESRMQKLFSLLPPDSVPINILQFADTRLDTPFRWAPRSLLASKWNLDSSMNFGTDYWDEDPVCGSVTPTGFRIESQGLVFPTSYALGVEFHIKDDFANWLNIRTYLLPREDTSPCLHDLSGVVTERLKWLLPSDAAAEIVFIPFSTKAFAARIFHEDANLGGGSKLGRGSEEQDALSCFGILGLLGRKTEEGEQCVRKICPASFLQITKTLGDGQLQSLELVARLFGIDTGASAGGNFSGQGGDQDVLSASRGAWTTRTWVID